MAQPSPKSWAIIIIDFFIGAIGGDLVVGLGVMRSLGRNYLVDANHIWIIFLASALISGSLAALYRNQFWSGVETYSIIPPIEEILSKQSKIVLWIIFALGCASLGLFYFY